MSAWLLGLAMGLAVVLAVRMSERAKRNDEVRTEYDLPEGISEVLSVLPGAAIVLDSGDDVVKASPTAYTFGLVRGHLVTNATLLELISRVRTRGLIEESDIEQPRGRSSRLVRTLHARVAPLGASYVLVLCDDRTEARRVEAMRRDFVANVSHELKTPIGAISLLAEAVAESSGDPQAVKRFSSRMQRESARLTSLVQEIIELSRVQQDDDVDTSDLLSVDELIDEATDRVRLIAEAKNIKLTSGRAEGLFVYGNFELLANALRNLLENAVNYSGPSTSVGVGARRDDDDMAVISVTDQGIGLSPEDVERVFERFYRVDPARSRQTGGTGLGLSIVKHIAASHGGEVRAWSQPGKGSTFTLVLPAADVDSAPAAPAGPRGAAAASPETDAAPAPTYAAAVPRGRDQTDHEDNR